MSKTAEGHLYQNRLPLPSVYNSTDTIRYCFFNFHINSHSVFDHMSYHGNMKKMSFLLASLFLLTSCSQQTYSLKEVAGLEVSSITQMQVSSDVYQSYAWTVDEKYYSYLDCSYILVSFDINEQFMGWPPKESKDDAIVIHLERQHPSYKKYKLYSAREG